MKTIKELRALQTRALAGNKSARDILIAENNAMRRTVNRRMRELEKSGTDYGRGYNRAINFANVQYNGNKFLSSNQLNGDIYAIVQQAEEAVLFLSDPYTTVSGKRKMEKERKETFISHGWIPEDISDRRFRNFLRFLGNEETQEIMQDWTTSGDVIEMLYDAYTSKVNSRKKLLNAFEEYLSKKGTVNQQTFNELMEEVGIDVANYPKREIQNFWNY